jgi:hypothetical protein
MIKCSTCKKNKSKDNFVKPNNTFFKSCLVCRAYQKNNYKRNSQQILQARADKIDCQCGSRISKGNMTNHLRSKKHKRYLDNKDKKPDEKYYFKFWSSKIDGVTYYHKSKKKSKMITCYCGSKFYASESGYDTHIMSEHHLYVTDILLHSKPYNDEYVIYEKILY